MAAPSGDSAANSGFAAEGQRREPAGQVFGEGVLPAPPLPLKPSVGRRWMERCKCNLRLAWRAGRPPWGLARRGSVRKGREGQGDLPALPARAAPRMDRHPWAGFRPAASAKSGVACLRAGCTWQGCHARSLPCSLGQAGWKVEAAGLAWWWSVGGFLAVALCPRWRYDDVGVWPHPSHFASRSREGGSAVGHGANPCLHLTRASSGCSLRSRR